MPLPEWQRVAQIIDHTNLRPEATREAITRLCQEAEQFGLGAVMLNPCYVALAQERLKGTSVRVGSVIGFPLGATLTTVKQFETSEVIEAGAREIDMVLNLGALKGGDSALVASDIAAVAGLVHRHGALLKVILETGLLTEEEKKLACRISVEAGADLVKTSTGFLGGVATVEDVVLMRSEVGTRAGVKASGGIRSAGEARAMIEAGATRLGTSSSVAIVREFRAEAGGL
jgi:deoxyribose-phosphate aldolase